jgi:hypothetical protein
VNASRVGVHTHPEPGQYPRRACQRCGIERQTKKGGRGAVLCGDCLTVTRRLDETEVWT